MNLSEGIILFPTLIYLVDTSEGHLCQLLQRHHVHRRADGLLAAALGPLAQILKVLALSEPHLKTNNPVSFRMYISFKYLPES